MKSKVSKMKSSNLTELRQNITRVWCQEITPELCSRLIDSMPHRIRAVLDNRGHPTRF